MLLIMVNVIMSHIFLNLILLMTYRDNLIANASAVMVHAALKQLCFHRPSVNNLHQISQLLPNFWQILYI